MSKEVVTYRWREEHREAEAGTDQGKGKETATLRKCLPCQLLGVGRPPRRDEEGT